MKPFTVTEFKPFPFSIGQKIRIVEGPRKGDWEVIGMGERKVKLKCPVSQKEFEWDRFCYYTDEKEQAIWPSKD